MALPAKAPKKYTYQDYLKFPEDLRCELIDGEIFAMTPSPFVKHQAIVRNLALAIGKFREKLRARGCDFFIAPLDVVLDEYNVVQPDLFIACGEFAEKAWIYHPPEVVFEVISKNTAYKDLELKKRLYERFRVKEYILVFPDLEIVEHFVLRDATYAEPAILNWDGVLKLETFEIEIPLSEIFEKSTP